MAQNNQVTFTGEVTSEETVKVTKGNFSEVNVPNNEGGVTTLRGKITEIISNLTTSQVAAIKMTLPNGQSELITSDRSPALKDEKGNDRPVPEGASFQPVYQGRAA